MKKTIKAYLINSQTLEISDCEITDYRSFYPLIGNDCSAFDCIRIDQKGTTLFVDDEGLLKPNTLTIIKTSTGVRQFAGNAVVVGTSIDGDSTAPAITKAQLARLIPLSSIKN